MVRSQETSRVKTARIHLQDAIEGVILASKDNTITALQKAKLENIADDLTGFWAEMPVRYEMEGKK